MTKPRNPENHVARPRSEAVHRVRNANAAGAARGAAVDLLRERDLRASLDDRTPAQRWLNDPPRGRSALDQRAPR
jgi:hypothetical protein